VIPKETRAKLGIHEGTTLELNVEDDELILRVNDLWSELRKRGRKLKVNLEKAERELDEEEENG
jgi:AbrB family looped-hinge helix DNA binding protein